MSWQLATSIIRSARQAHSLGRFVSSHGVLAIIATVGGVLVILLRALAGGIYDSVAKGDGISSFDRPVLDGSMSAETGPWTPY
jgi:hypothetical protein